MTLGHEFCGTVVACGDKVRQVQVGEFVSAESHVTCGMCYQCRTGQAHMCPNTEILGVDREGAFAHYVVVPEKVIWKNDRTKLPPDIATLQEPFGNAVFATMNQDLSGKSVLVLGCGPIGLFTVAIWKAVGASAEEGGRYTRVSELAASAGPHAPHGPLVPVSAKEHGPDTACRTRGWAWRRGESNPGPSLDLKPLLRA